MQWRNTRESRNLILDLHSGEDSKWRKENVCHSGSPPLRHQRISKQDLADVIVSGLLCLSSRCQNCRPLCCLLDISRRFDWPQKRIRHTVLDRTNPPPHFIGDDRFKLNLVCSTYLTFNSAFNSFLKEQFGPPLGDVTQFVLILWGSKTDNSFRRFLYRLMRLTWPIGLIVGFLNGSFLRLAKRANPWSHLKSMSNKISIYIRAIDLGVYLIHYWYMS